MLSHKPSRISACANGPTTSGAERAKTRQDCAARLRSAAVRTHSTTLLSVGSGTSVIRSVPGEAASLASLGAPASLGPGYNCSQSWRVLALAVPEVVGPFAQAAVYARNARR